MKFLSIILEKILDFICDQILATRLKKTFQKQGKSVKDYVYERPIEYAFTLSSLVRHKSLEILDVGTGRSAFPRVLEDAGFRVSCVDQKSDYWNSKIVNRHIHVLDDDICKSKLKSETFDAVLCISVLEHIAAHETAVGEMVRLLKPKGLLLLTFPYSSCTYCPNVYELQDSDKFSSSFNYIAQSFNDETINNWTKKFNLRRDDQSYFRGWTGQYWRCGERIKFPELVADKNIANGICLALVKSSD